MLQNNPLLAQLKQQLHQQTPRIEGIIQAHDKGFGFLETEDKKRYFIPVNKMKNVLNGDKVSGQIVCINDKESFEPETLIESSLQDFLGSIVFDNKAMVIIPENNRHIMIRCKVNHNVAQRLKAGDWVKAKLITHALQHEKNTFFAEITQFVAEQNNPNLLWLLTLARYNLETSPPADQTFTLNEAELAQRVDLTQVDFFTIDGKNTLDMDDAIHINTDEHGNYIVSIAIADPSSFFSEQTATDHEAKIRCYTTYLPDFTVPMLPTLLSNECCSLKAEEKRPAVVCQIMINPQGDIIQNSSKFFLAWITSKAKFSYDEVSDFLENNIALSTENSSLIQQLNCFAQLAQIRIQWRTQHALLFKEKNDYSFIFDNDKHLIDIVKESKRIAHKIVEEAMVMANLVFTNYISQQLGFGIFNIHNGFESKYLDLVVKLLQDAQIADFDKERLATFAGYKDLRQRLDDDKYQLLEYRLRRYLSPADFALTPQEHFGMGFDAYATWTSPIRKYGDLLNHRLIKALLLNQTPHKPDEEVLTIMNERRKVLRFAERDINQKLYCLFLNDKINQQFKAEIIDINRGGAKVRLIDIGAIGFMPLSLIHPVKNEIVVQPEMGRIAIKEEIVYQLLDSINVVINVIKPENSSIIVKLANDS